MLVSNFPKEKMINFKRIMKLYRLKIKICQKIKVNAFYVSKNKISKKLILGKI